MMRWMRRLWPAMLPEPVCLRAECPATGVDLLVLLMDELGDRFAAPAAERLRAIVAATPAADRVRLDEAMRRRLGAWDRSGLFPWFRKLADVGRLALPPGTEGAVLGLIAAAPSGFVREAAVERLARLGDGSEVAPLLVRANDWVEPVRRRALDALSARLRPEYAEHWIAALPLVLRLCETARARSGLAEDVLDLLRAPESREALWRGMHSPDRVVRRTCFRLMLDLGPRGLEALVRGVLGNPDELIRLQAARAAVQLDDGALSALVPRMLADRSTHVRLAAIPLAADRIGRAALPVLRGALLNRGAVLRAEARAGIERLEPMDFAAFYRARLEVDARLAEAVAGLMETGEAWDADLVAPYLHHPRPRVRAAALRALDRLSGDGAIPALTAAVGDAVPSVSRAAADALRPRVARAAVTALTAWFAEGHPAHVRGNALALLAARGKWSGIGWIVRACGDADPAVRAAGLQQLHRWRQRFNRGFAQPTAEQQAAVRAALAHAGDALDAAALRWLRFAAGLHEKESNENRM